MCHRRSLSRTRVWSLLYRTHISLIVSNTQNGYDDCRQGVKISVNSKVDLSANMRNWTYMNVFYSTAFAYLQSSFFIQAAGNGIVNEE